jgi:hypothetical protein
MADSDHLRKTLEHYKRQRQQKLDELRPIEEQRKQKLDELQPIELMIRQLLRDLGEAPSIEPPTDTIVDTLRQPQEELGLHPMLFLKPDEFYGMSQSDAAKTYLRRVGHAITFDELVEALRKGGAKLGGVDPKKTLYVSLARNPRKEFVWPNKDHISLKEFYDNRTK